MPAAADEQPHLPLELTDSPLFKGRELDGEPHLPLIHSFVCNLLSLGLKQLANLRLFIRREPGAGGEPQLFLTLVALYVE